ncbi:MAG: pyridoxal phosphate-dependent aminotransferase [Planctomycetota bacterium]
MPDTQILPSLSARVSSLKPSVTVAVTNRAKAMKAEGQNVLGFAAGEPDFDTPGAIKQAAIDALTNNQTRYMPTLGDTLTRGSVAEKLTRENGIPGLSADHVAITVGGKHALFAICQCLFDPPAPGEAPMEGVLPTPAWVSYAPIVRLAGGEIVEVETTPGTDFKISPEQLKAAITQRTRAVFLNSPSNPCGTMYTPDELRALGAVIAEAASTIAPELVVVSDEIYEKIIYGGIAHLSPGSIPEIADRVITINGLSKAYAMTGWRVGYACASGDWGKTFVKAMGTLQGQMTTNITSFVYPAIRTALSECADEVEQMRQAFAKRAELIHGLLGELPGIVCPRPTGAFYVFPDVSAHFGKTTKGGVKITNALSFCESLLAEELVALVPGDDFGGCGPNHCRISFACSEEQINAGMERLGRFLAGLS